MQLGDKLRECVLFFVLLGLDQELFGRFRECIALMAGPDACVCGRPVHDSQASSERFLGSPSCAQHRLLKYVLLYYKLLSFYVSFFFYHT